MRGQTNASIVGNSLQKALRNRMTGAERRLWQRLRGRQIGGCKFRRQHPFLDYVLDFVCLERRLVVEVDGGQHLESETDHLRDQRLVAAGFRILRFWNNQVLQETDVILEAIWIALQEQQNTGSSPFKGEGRASDVCDWTGRRGMGDSARRIRNLDPNQPHPPPSLPLEGGGARGVGRSRS